MAYYVKVTPTVANHFHLTEIRNKTADSNYLLWQSELNSVKGYDIFQKTDRCGGAVLTPQYAKSEIVGTKNPVPVFTPSDFPESLQKEEYEREEPPKPEPVPLQPSETPAEVPTEQTPVDGEQQTTEGIQAPEEPTEGNLEPTEQPTNKEENK